MCQVTKDVRPLAAVPADLTSASPSHHRSFGSKTLLVWLEMRQEYGFCVNIRTESTGASGEHENTQTRLLIYCPITRQITATGDVERGVCLVRMANRNRTECFAVRHYLLIACKSTSNTEDSLRIPTLVTLHRFSCHNFTKRGGDCRWLVSNKKANVLIYSFFNRNTQALSGVINLQWKDQAKWGSDSHWSSTSTQLPSLWWNVK